LFKQYLKELNLPESYISITLGFLVVIVAGLLIFNYFNRGNVTEQQKKQEEAAMEEQQKKEITLPTTHTVADDETLWNIAEKYYQSGYNWVTIASENKLANADRITVGQTLVIPQAETIKPPTGDTLSTATEQPKSYTVIEGDSLWKIAVKEFNDGYAWVKIANVNKLANPDIINPGQVLTLPR